MSSEVQGTSLDAIASKLSSASLGYFNDPFLPYFVPERLRRRRSPLINRGYCTLENETYNPHQLTRPRPIYKDARFTIFESTISKFMSTWPSSPHQIISLGGGWETNYFRMKSEGRAPHLYVEIDLPLIVAQKAAVVKSIAALLECLSNPVTSQFSYETIRADGYRLLECDLTDLTTLTQRLIETGVDTSLPTLFVSECVLVYVSPQASGELIAWAGSIFPRSAFCTYEQILPDDAFGDMMIRNLRSRGIELVGIQAHPNLPSQIERFKNRGWARVEAFDMKTVYHKLLPQADLRRIERLEIFDEFEEFHLMMAHYAFTLAVNGDGDDNGKLTLMDG